MRRRTHLEIPRGLSAAQTCAASSTSKSRSTSRRRTTRDAGSCRAGRPAGLRTAQSRRRRRPACSATTRRATSFRSARSGSNCRAGDRRACSRRAQRSRASRSRAATTCSCSARSGSSDSMHLNSVGLGNPVKRTCSTCHGMHMTGMDVANGWMDIGTTNLPWAREAPLNPWTTRSAAAAAVQSHLQRRRRCRIRSSAASSTRRTRAARSISGKCNDVGAIVMQQFRGLAARAPYFSNGSAATLRELVDFYDRRYTIGYSEQEKQDLVNFPERAMSRHAPSCSCTTTLARSCRVGAAMSAPADTAQLRELPHRARHRVGAVLARRIRRRALFPDAADGRQLAGHAAVARPSRARRGHRRARSSRASAAASCSSPWCCRCCRSSTPSCNTHVCPPRIATT